jgi:type I restriction enzyme S subunit
MAGEWQVTTLGNCVKFISGGTPSKADATLWGGSIPWFSAKDMKSFWVDDSEDLLTNEGGKAATSLVPAGSTLLLVRGMTLHNDIPIVRVRRPSPTIRMSRAFCHEKACLPILFLTSC